MDKLANDEAFREKFQSDVKATFVEYGVDVPDELIYNVTYIKQKEKMGKVKIGTKEKEECRSYGDFLDFCDEDTLAEWVNGKMEMYSPASYAHQDLAGWLTSVIRIYATTESGVILPAPFQMKTERDLPGREPDIIFVRKENLGMLKETYLYGPADLAIEIVSEERLLRDRSEKFAEYEIGGVKEYWVLDPELKSLERTHLI